MKGSDFCRLARRLMRQAAVPYQEDAVSEEVVRICSEHGFTWRRDHYGNLLVSWRRGARGGRPLVLAAHMDHPGFEVLGALRGKPGRWEARFLGGVGPSYFKPGVKLRLGPGGGRARLGRALARSGHYEIKAEEPVQAGEAPRYAVWDLVDCQREGRRLVGRACDDLVGVAAILAVLIECRQSQRSGWVIGAISRAEEVGFQGALALAAAGTLPRNSLVLSLETSREMPPVRLGQGVIIRVGDRASVFDAAATRFLTETAEAMARNRKGFSFQKALMAGGTCEGTAYQEYGYQTGAVCVALGHYHNCGEGGKLAAEYVEVADACGMVDLLVEAAGRMGEFGRLTGRLPGRLKRLLAEGRKRLSPS